MGGCGRGAADHSASDFAHDFAHTSAYTVAHIFAHNFGFAYQFANSFANSFANCISWQIKCSMVIEVSNVRDTLSTCNESAWSAYEHADAGCVVRFMLIDFILF